MRTGMWIRRSKIVLFRLLVILCVQKHLICISKWKHHTHIYLYIKRWNTSYHLHFIFVWSHFSRKWVNWGTTETQKTFQAIICMKFPLGLIKYNWIMLGNKMFYVENVLFWIPVWSDCWKMEKNIMPKQFKMITFL